MCVRVVLRFFILVARASTCRAGLGTCGLGLSRTGGGRRSLRAKGPPAPLPLPPGRTPHTWHPSPGSPDAASAPEPELQRQRLSLDEELLLGRGLPLAHSKTLT